MRIRPDPGTAAATLLVGMFALQWLAGPGGRWPQSFTPPVNNSRALPLPGSSARAALEWCRENVTIIHDVHWATACSTHAEVQRASHAEAADDSPECTLPADRASALNAARAQAEDQCLAEAVAADPGSAAR
jgi:hypothetical protein